MRKSIRTLMCLMLASSMLLAGCNVKTKSDVTPDAGSSAGIQTEGNRTPVPINIVTLATLETEANVVRDQLKKSGFEVTVNIQPDYGSLFTQVDARNYDIYMGTMKVLSGNPDYGCRSMFHSQGEDNHSKILDPEVDRLIDLGATQLPKDALATYAQLEKYVVEEHAFYVPVCRMMNTYAYNKALIKNDTVEVGRSKYLYWNKLDYNDQSLLDTQPLVLTGNQAPAQFDPMTQGNTFRFLANTNVKLLELTNSDEITTDGALSQSYTIGEGNDNFYFVLRDNINFATNSNKTVVDTGIPVGGEDVVYTVNRLRTKEAVPGHKVYDNYQIVSNVEQITDLEALKSVKSSVSGKSVFDDLNTGLPTPIASLASDKASVNNQSGSYEVIKISTKTPFPQILNFLCGYETGILCKEQVEKINDFDPATFDPSKDSRYGDLKFVTEGANYQSNHLYSSGPYTIAYANDYEVVCERNPGFMPGTASVPKIKTVKTKIITDLDAAISALRSGEIHLAEVPSNLVSVVKGDSSLGTDEELINGVVNIMFNLDDGKITQNEDIRKAVLYSVNQEEIVAVKDGVGGKAYTALTMLDTGNEQNADPVKAKEHLDNYYKTLGQ